MAKCSIALAIAGFSLWGAGSGRGTSIAWAAPQNGGGAPSAPSGGGQGGGQSGSGAPASGTTGTSSPSLGGAITSPDTIIGADDELQISILEHPEVSNEYLVPSKGPIDVPRIGNVEVLGATLGNLKKKLTKLFGKVFYEPDIVLSLRPSEKSVNVIGVARAGKILIKPGDRILQVLAMSGGLPYDRPENFRITVLRGPDAIPVDVPKLYGDDPAQNIVLQSDDTVYVQEKDPTLTQVQVVGEVGKPGAVLLPRDRSIITVLQDAGGPTQMAALKQASILRDGSMTPIPVDLSSYRKTGFEPAEKLEPGDRLIIPTNRNEYYVVGAAPRTGPQLYPEDRNLTVSSALALAGVSTEGVDLTKVKLTHPLPAGTMVAGSPDQVTTVNVSKMYKSGIYTNDPPVVPGDTIYVPTSTPSKGLSFTQTLAILGSLGGLVGLYEIFK